MFKDILLPLPVHPEPTPQATLVRAVEFAALLGGHVTALGLEPKLSMPVAVNVYGGSEMERLLKERQAEVHEAVQSALADFAGMAKGAGVPHEVRTVGLADIVSFDPVVAAARLRDLTVLPVAGQGGTWDDLAQALIFESGRPVLVLPETAAAPSLDSVVVAWDSSLAAARALGDALPLLERAGQVRVVTVSRDRDIAGEEDWRDLASRLERNGVRAVLDVVDPGSRGVGEALDDAAAGAGLVVMGAFGHSRIRDFFLGGATKHVLKAPARPTFLSR